MNHEQVTRKDFPAQDQGYDRPSVDAHLLAVAASMMALEAQVRAIEVERDALRGNTGSRPPAATPIRSVPEPAPATPIRSVPDQVDPDLVEPEPVEAIEPVTEPVAEEPDPEPVDEVVPEIPAPDVPAPEASGDESGARLVAMKMALDGSDREAIRARLKDDYSLTDVEALLDDVLKRVG